MLLMRTLKAIIYNRGVDLVDLANSIFPVLFQTLYRDVSDLSLSSDDDILKVKTQAGHLIWQLIERLEKQQPTIRNEIANRLINRLFTQAPYPPIAAGDSPLPEAALIHSGYILFGILFTLSQLRGEVLKTLITKHLLKIDHILQVKRESYSNTRQMDAINRSFLIMQEATFILLRHMLQNEPANEEGLKQVKDLAI
jgi:hypothetical protein